MPIPEETPETGPDGKPVSHAGKKFIAHNGPETFAALGTKADNIKWDLEGRNVKQPLEAIKGSVFNVGGTIGSTPGAPAAAAEKGRGGGMFGEIPMGHTLMGTLGTSMNTLVADLQKVWRSFDYLGSTLPAVGEDYAKSDKVGKRLVEKVQAQLDPAIDPASTKAK